MKKDLKLPARITLVVVSGALMPLCFPPFGWWPLLLVTFPPLFLATTNTTPRRAYYLGMLQGGIGYAGSLYWFFHIFAQAAPFLFAILAMFTGLFCLLLNIFTQKKTPVALQVLVAATLWTGIEFYRAELFFLCFPWITPGSALGPTLLSPIFGVYGASFLIIGTCAGFLQHKTILPAVALTLCILYLGLFPPPPVQLDESNSITVTVVQNEDCLLSSYVQLTDSARSESPDLIIWPEYALPYDIRKQPDRFAILTNLCAETKAILVVGTQTHIDPEKHLWYNTALTLNQNGVLGEYYKARPVHLFNDGTPGTDFSPISTPLGAIGTPICFDNDYTAIVRKMVLQGAEFLAVPSFDAASWSTNQHVQHALLFRLRAAENGRWLACAASSGISQIIDPHGNVRASLPPMQTDVITGRIGKSSTLTVFTRAGWIFPWLTLGCTGILIVYAMITRIARKFQ
jgi:apolipoprotein N-acyltransferase